MKMTYITINGSKILSEKDFHENLAKALGITDFYGKNLDALWDTLACNVERPVTLIWQSHKISKEKMGEGFDRILNVLIEVKNQDESFGWSEKFDFLLE